MRSRCLVKTTIEACYALHKKHITSLMLRKDHKRSMFTGMYLKHVFYNCFVASSLGTCVRSSAACCKSHCLPFS